MEQAREVARSSDESGWDKKNGEQMIRMEGGSNEGADSPRGDHREGDSPSSSFMPVSLRGIISGFSIEL